ncbi:heavy-metal-associated domain-containing protein [Cuniculiplasma divulgatum]|uniref:Metallochaperone n=1 Tax=Cuniculiplasma divulgatum TaxID=1673428 RepID=A0A1N5W1Y5_9ARCH|nr:heavy-metal-associated domain-containing protein [Cuniculiplasma divulgatum]SIM79283.1 metallochaperone [Cuniculiplasma divulgatum]
MTQKKVELKIFGMTSNECEGLVSKGLKTRDGVKDAVIDFKLGLGTVEIDDTKVSPEDLIRLPVFTQSHYRAQIRKVE